MLAHFIPDWNNANSTLIKKSETELRVNFLGSSGQLYVYGSDRPELMRGPNPMGVVLDEFSVERQEVWEEIVQPVMRSNPNAWCWFLFTPRGKNHAFKVYNFGLDSNNEEWKSWKMTVYDSGIYQPDQIEKARQTMSQATFNQELMCEFLEGAGTVFRGIRDVCNAVLHNPIAGHYYVIGIDLAKHEDFTVIAVYDRTTNAQVYQDRFNTIEWPFQKKRIKAIADHYNHALVAIDATGLGDPIADDLARADVAVEPIKFTESIKKELIEKLSIWIEQKRIRILPIEQTINELENFSYEIGDTGRVHYGAPEGFNDDCVIAHALAVWRLNPIYKERYEKPKTIIQEEFERQVKNYDSDIAYERELNEWASDFQPDTT